MLSVLVELAEFQGDISHHLEMHCFQVRELKLEYQFDDVEDS